MFEGDEEEGSETFACSIRGVLLSITDTPRTYVCIGGGRGGRGRGGGGGGQ